MTATTPPHRPWHPAHDESRMRLLSTSLILLALPTALAAQDIGLAEYAARRDSLAARIDSGIVVAFGAPSPTGVRHPEQLPAFRYLTGFLEPDAALVLVVRGGRPTGTLYTQARDPRRALYDGFPPDSAGVARQTGTAGAVDRGAGDRRSTRWPRPACRSTPCATTPAAITARPTRSRAARPSCGRSWTVIRASSSAMRTRSSTVSGRGRARPSWRCFAARSTSRWPRSARRCGACDPAGSSTRSTRCSARPSAGPAATGRRSARSWARAPTRPSITMEPTAGGCRPARWS